MSDNQLRDAKRKSFIDVLNRLEKTLGVLDFFEYFPSHRRGADYQAVTKND